MYFSVEHIKFLFYIISTTRTIHINKPFMGLKYHQNFYFHLWPSTECENKFAADSRFLDIKSTAAVL